MEKYRNHAFERENDTDDSRYAVMIWTGADLRGSMAVIEIPFLLLEVVYTAVWLMIRIAVWAKKRKIDPKREALLLLMYINLAVIIRFAFFPMARANGHVQPLVFDAASAFPFRVNPVPLVKLLDYEIRRELLLNLIADAAMSIPAGISLPIVYRRLDTFPKVLAAGIGMSLCIEIFQLPFSARASDVDDLILNTLGVIAGYGIYTLIRKRAGQPDKAG